MSQPNNSGNLLRGVAAWTAAAGLLLSLPASVDGQDFERYRPNPPTAAPYRPELPQPDRSPVEGSTKVLIKELKGIIVVDHKDKIVKEPADVAGILVDPSSDLTLARGYGVQSIMQRYIGQEISIRKLNEMSRDIVIFYGNCGQPVVDVSIPPQDVTRGVIQVIITEARIGKIVVKGGCYFDPGILACNTWLRSGTRIYESCLRRELTYFNQNPFYSVGLDLEEGDSPGTTDVVFSIKDQYPWRHYISYEDTGTRLTHLERLSYGFNWGNALKKGDMMSYQFTSGPNWDDWSTDRLAVHSASYSARTYCRDELLIYGSYADIEVPGRRLGVPGTAFNGESWQVSGRYTRDTGCGCGWDSNRWSVGLDVKSTNNLFDFGIATLNNNTYEVFQFMAGWVGRRQRGCWNQALGLDGFFSPGYLMERNTDAAFQNFRANADSTYAYMRMFTEHMYTGYNYGYWVIRGSGQLASGRLVPTEQLGFGGFNTIRGYDQRVLNGDNGFIGNLELRSKTIYGCCRGQQTALTLLSFIDAGYLANWGNNPNLNNNEVVASTGLGLRYIINPSLTVRADYGLPFNSLQSLPGASYDGRVHLGVVLAH